MSWKRQSVMEPGGAEWRRKHAPLGEASPCREIFQFHRGVLVGTEKYVISPDGLPIFALEELKFLYEKLKLSLGLSPAVFRYFSIFHNSPSDLTKLRETWPFHLAGRTDIIGLAIRVIPDRGQLPDSLAAFAVTQYRLFSGYVVIP